MRRRSTTALNSRRPYYSADKRPRSVVRSDQSDTNARDPPTHSPWYNIVRRTDDGRPNRVRVPAIGRLPFAFVRRSFPRFYAVYGSREMPIAELRELRYNFVPLGVGYGPRTVAELRTCLVNRRKIYGRGGISTRSKRVHGSPAYLDVTVFIFFRIPTNRALRGRALSD